MVDGDVAGITELLAGWREGDRKALEELAPIVYPELRRIAHRYLKREGATSRFSTTELAHEVYLRLANDPPDRWDSRAHFFGIVARLIRRVLVDAVRQRRAQKRGGDLVDTPIEELRDVSNNVCADVLALHQALDELARTHERKARVLELRYFGGLEGDEIAAALDISPATVARELRVGKAWLRDYLSS